MTRSQRYVAWLVAVLAALLIFAHVSRAQVVTRDSTLYTATRIRTTAAGQILSVSITKLTTLPSGRVDTVRITRVDTVHVKDPLYTQYFYWTPYLRGDSIYYQFASNNNDGTTPKPVPAPRGGGHDTLFYWFQPNVNQRGDSITWNGPLVWPQTVSPRPSAFKLPLGPGGKIDTVRIVRVDTVRSKPDTVWYLAADNCGCAQSDSSLHIMDYPSRAGEMNVYTGARYLGRLAYQGTAPNRTWWAYQYWPGMMQMPRLPSSYPDSLSAMRGLLNTTSIVTSPYSPKGVTPKAAPARKVTVPRKTAPPNSPELPRIFLDTRMPAVPKNGDTLFAPAMGSTVWRCVGPTVALDPRCPQYKLARQRKKT